MRARQALGFALTQLSDVTRQLGEVDTAVEYGRRAVDTYESLAPSENLWRRGSAWEMLGRATLQSGRRSQGCAALRRAGALYTKTSTGPPGERYMLRPDVQKSLEQTLETCPQ